MAEPLFSLAGFLLIELPTIEMFLPPPDVTEEPFNVAVSPVLSKRQFVKNPNSEHVNANWSLVELGSSKRQGSILNPL